MKLVHLVGSIKKKFVSMHGHMNVKNKTECTGFGSTVIDASTPLRGTLNRTIRYSCSEIEMNNPLRLLDSL